MASIRSTELLLSLISDAYAAAAEPALWRPFLERVESVTGSSRSYILSIDTLKRSSFACQNGFDPALAEIYNEHFAAADPLVIAYERARRRAKGNFVGSRRAVMGDTEYRAMPMFHEIIAAQKDFHLCVVMAQLGTYGSAALALRRCRTGSEFEPEVVDLLAALTPHLRQALMLYGRLSDLGDVAGVFARSADAHGLAILGIDRNGRITVASKRAEQILSCGNGISARQGQLHASCPKDSDRLTALIASAIAISQGRGIRFTAGLLAESRPQGSRAASTTLAGGGAMLVSRRSPQPPLRISVIPFTSPTALVGVSTVALVFFGDDSSSPNDIGAMLHTLYRATPTEVRIAQSLLCGSSVQQIADELRLTASAVRFHLKSLFRRTGTRRQSELLRLLASLPRDVL